MIAVAMSGGLDSTAAAILLKEQGEDIMGVTMSLGPGIPDQAHLERGAEVCKKLDIPFHVLELEREFEHVRQYFCDEYLTGRTPNPCAICNPYLKFGIFREKVAELGAERVATGHYVKKGEQNGRYFLQRGPWRQSQEYFMALIPQDAIRDSIFPLGDYLRPEVEELVSRAGFDFPRGISSQDVCFVSDGAYAAYIEEYDGFRPEPGNILDVDGKVVGKHRGALHYTIGQRKGLGMGFGRRVYVLAVDMQNNTVTIGDRNEWPHKGFYLGRPNFMRIASIDEPMTVRLKVRYRQEMIEATAEPTEDGRIWINHDGLFASGQLAVLYDDEDAVLAGGIIEGE